MDSEGAAFGGGICFGATITLILMLILIARVQGCIAQQTETFIRNDAVKAGAGEWTVNEVGEVNFNWKTLKTAEKE